MTLTAHPSSILRARDDAARQEAMDQLVADFAWVGSWMADHRSEVTD